MIRCLILLVLLAGCSNPPRDIDYSTTGPLVRLYYAPLSIIGFIAIHPYFITYDKGEWHRWEVWHTGGVHTDGVYLYKDLFPLNYSIGNSGQWIEEEWHGEEARRLLAVLYRSFDNYPYAREYWVWPGPNSNTFAGWVLCKARIKMDFPLRAIGSKYR